MPIIANFITRPCRWETRPRPAVDLNGAWHLRNAKIFAKLMQTAGWPRAGHFRLRPRLLGSAISCKRRLAFGQSSRATICSRDYSSGFSSASALLASVRLHEVERRADGDDAGRINFFVRHVVVALDVIEVYGLGNGRLLIEIHQVTLQIGVIDDAPDVALEVAVIHDVEAHKGAEKAPVGFDDATAQQVTASR
jgi:hypothetical protein